MVSGESFNFQGKRPDNTPMSKSTKYIFDHLHGSINLCQVEARIMETPYYQRLRWIRQLGFTFYIFSGANHSRFSHTLGVLHVMDRILKNIGKAASDEDLYNPKCQTSQVVFHRTMRLAAMLHDIGAFPFSHSIEFAYTNHWKSQQSQGRKSKHPANHEYLGSEIITHTDFDHGITKILKEEGIDPEELSLIIAGKSQNTLANQLMHSDIDADRMDYLLRDSLHTGIQLGKFDLDALIRNLTTFTHKGQEYLAVKENGLISAEHFLISRYAWYSQIISDGTSYKFDLIAAKLQEYFLENKLTYSFDEIVEKVIANPNSFFTFNDDYFMAKVHKYLSEPTPHPIIQELAHMLAYRIPPAQIKLDPIQPTLVKSDEHRQEMVEETTKIAHWLKAELKSLNPDAWIIFDIPSKDVMFTKNVQDLKKISNSNEILTLRDPVKILRRDGTPELLVNVSNSLMSILSNYRNFLPRIYVSPKTYEFLEEKKILKAWRDKTYKVTKNTVA